MDKYRIDGEKLHFHPARVAQWQAADTWEKAKDVYPLYVEISPVGACNHRCTFCAVDYIGYKSVQIEGARLRDTLRDMAAVGVKSVMFAGEGEPLLHKEINACNIAAVSAGLDTAFTTNGVLLNKLETIDLCSWVKVSVNGGTAKTYAAVHSTKEKDWDTVWANIKEAVKRKDLCTLGVQTLLLPELEGEIQELYDRCDEAGVDYLVVKPYSQHKSSITKQYEHARPRPPEVRIKRCQFIFREETYANQAFSYEKCRATPNFWAYLQANGDVYSCSAYLLDERFRLGNINTHGFRDIWQGDLRRANWEMMQRHDISECRVNCRMDRANKYLADLEGVPHANFI